MSFPHTPPQGGPHQPPHIVYVPPPPTGTRPIDTAAGVAGWLLVLFVGVPIALCGLAAVATVVALLFFAD